VSTCVSGSVRQSVKRTQLQPYFDFLINNLSRWECIMCMYLPYVVDEKAVHLQPMINAEWCIKS